MILLSPLLECRLAGCCSALVFTPQLLADRCVLVGCGIQATAYKRQVRDLEKTIQELQTTRVLDDKRHKRIISEATDLQAKLDLATQRTRRAEKVGSHILLLTRVRHLVDAAGGSSVCWMPGDDHWLTRSVVLGPCVLASFVGPREVAARPYVCRLPRMLSS